MKRFFLISTEHLEEALWFRDDEDFAAGMNYVAIEAFLHNGVLVLAFILMSNHVHFFLYGERGDVEKFASDFKGRYAHYYHIKYESFKLLKKNNVDIEVIEHDGEHFERAVAYVIMNCVGANICAHPSQYPWGSGYAYFQPIKPEGRRLKDFSVRARRKILHSTENSLPLEWIVSEKGYILPENYVGIKAVESRFKSPQRMNYFLNSSSKAKKRLSSEEALPAFRDQVILQALPDLMWSLFQKKSSSELTEEERTECLRQIRYRFSADITQAARVLGVTYAEAARLVDKS